MTTTAASDFQFAAYQTVPYDREWTLYKNGAVLNLTGWTGLTLALRQAGGTHTITLSQVSTAVQGIRPLTPVSAGIVRVRIDEATLDAVPLTRKPGTMVGELRGVNPEGLNERLLGVVMTLNEGV